MNEPAPMSQTPPAPDSTPALRALRLQAAVVRALLDELEDRTSSAAFRDVVAEQLAEELGRLGRELLRVSAHIAPEPRG